ncbi:MAG: hypothetical protein PHY74_02715 [Candidatus Bathyarchaeota archaeon]|nr:hypothetical protein [Candidatus Bathyarchaeota archaeon]MDI9578577.1 hypothetical protein [Thermoproteota archaeon]MDT8782286.1 hypothetical protein [Candidatus Bathyarchaeota archaeon]NLD65382.1 hypothetical protein [Thermoproteota archaeon]
MSNKNLTISRIIILISLVTVITFLATCFLSMQSINPVAALSATIVAVIGMIWFKKSIN